MTPSQLDHLRRIDAHLASLLENAKKRTPGRWTIKTQQRELGQSGEFETEAWIAPDDASKCVTNGWNLEDEDEDNFAFIASCAGNAEAGWESTRAAICGLLLIAQFDLNGRVVRDESLNGRNAEYALERILAQWPLEPLANG